ncbi:hypothetical protein MKK50_01500 [Methylobacterium sp. J-043]|nr:hypothetical protein [Methylobacterium sp. J-043]
MFIPRIASVLCLLLISTQVGAQDAKRFNSPSFNAPVVDRLCILGTGSTGDLSTATVIPDSSAASGTLSRLIADRAPLTSPSFSGTASMAVLNIAELIRIKSGGKVGGVLQAGAGLTFLASVDPVTEQLVKSIVVTTDGVNLNGPVTAYEGGTLLAPFTYGGNASAAGYTFSTNGLVYGIPNWLAQPGLLSTHASRDHAGMTRAMRAPNSVPVLAANATYTANTIASPNLSIDANIKLGMVIDTLHAPKFSGVVTAINASSKTLTVNGWYRVDRSSATGTPMNGVGAIINPASKLWLSNDILYCGDPGKNDIACAGTELNVTVNNSRVVEAYGNDAVIYGSAQPTAAYAFPARWGGQTTKWRAASFGQDNLGGLLSVQSAGTDYAMPLVEARVAGEDTFAMDHMGKMSAVRLRALAVTASATLDRYAGAKVIGTQSAAITITLPSPTDVNDGREIEVVNQGTGAITVVRPNGSTVGTVGVAYSQRFFAFQSNWLPISKTPLN